MKKTGVAKLTQRDQDAKQKIESLSQVIDGYSTGRSLSEPQNEHQRHLQRVGLCDSRRWRQ